MKGLSLVSRGDPLHVKASVRALSLQEYLDDEKAPPRRILRQVFMKFVRGVAVCEQGALVEPSRRA